MSLLTLEEVSFGIGDSLILNGVSLEIQPGEKVGLIGPNGSGKTTLFNCISGFNIPDAGTITFKGQDITRFSPARRAGIGVGRLFQNFGIFREMTVLENILVALESKQPPSLLPWGNRHAENRERALGYLSGVGLDAKANDKAGSLSGGQLRLLEISRLIAFGAELFLFDEPTAGVSPKMKGEIEGNLRALKDVDATVLIIEHDINFIQRLCDRVLVLDIGKVVLDGTPEEVRNDSKLQDIYFGSEAESHSETTPGITAPGITAPAGQ